MWIQTVGGGYYALGNAVLLEVVEVDDNYYVQAASSAAGGNVVQLATYSSQADAEAALQALVTALGLFALPPASS